MPQHDANGAAHYHHLSAQAPSGVLERHSDSTNLCTNYHVQKFRNDIKSNLGIKLALFVVFYFPSQQASERKYCGMESMIDNFTPLFGKCLRILLG